jgi:hypothetical protein
MDKNTKCSISELLSCIKHMKTALDALNHAEANADDHEKFSKHVGFYRSIGAIEAQAKIVQIDLDIYEKDFDEREKLPDGVRCGQCSNYVCNDTVYPTMVTFADGRIVTVRQEMEEGRYYLNVSPKSEYPKPCGICDGVIQSADDLEWHGYGNCREIPEPIMKQF